MFSKLFEEDLFDHITLKGSVSGRKSYGGTARQNVLRMIAQARKETGKW